VHLLQGNDCVVFLALLTAWNERQRERETEREREREKAVRLLLYSVHLTKKCGNNTVILSRRLCNNWEWEGRQHRRFFSISQLCGTIRAIFAGNDAKLEDVISCECVSVRRNQIYWVVAPCGSVFPSYRWIWLDICIVWSDSVKWIAACCSWIRFVEPCGR
jgi:hypothetical protein